MKAFFDGLAYGSVVSLSVRILNKVADQTREAPGAERRREEADRSCGTGEEKAAAVLRASGPHL